MCKNLGIGLSEVISFISGAAIAIFAEPIRRWLFRPKINVRLEEHNGCVVRTIGISRTMDQPIDMYYIRLRVINTHRFIAKGCSPYLVNIEKEEEGKFSKTGYCDSIPLAWSCQSEKDRFVPMDIPKGVNQYIDVLNTNMYSDSFNPQIMAMPFRYQPLFKEKGKFRFTVEVCAENITPTKTAFVFEWNGVWNEFAVNGQRPNAKDTILGETPPAADKI